MSADAASSELPEALEQALLRVLGQPSADQPGEVAELCCQHPSHAASIHGRLEELRRLVEALRSGQPPEDDQPDHIDSYRILDVLGEGGMGTVYLAEQREPIVRRVALKVIKLGMDTRHVLRRFEAERQALAIMEHDNIARVLDAGATERGRAYFVMEYVKGVPITEYCTQQRLSIRDRLLLFRQVCAGVQHAHQKGIVHRDLKPSNVLVTLQGGQGAPKIIDFGLARATDHRLVQQTLYTEPGRFVGTLPYMSPEQAGMGRLDIDTRTDIYSLGVLLYELLTGSLPFPIDELSPLDPVEMQRKLREQDPPKPSTRVSSLDVDTTRSCVASRATDRRSLLRRLRGDLDWITMKALEKDRTRRYQSADALSDDVLRHLEDEPVEAGPPSAGYRLRKLLRRHRGQVVAGGLVLGTVVVGAVVALELALQRARAIEDYQNLLVGAELDSLAFRAEHAHPCWLEQQAELTQLVAIAERLVGRIPELERVTERLARDQLLDAPAERSPDRGPHVLDARVKELESERATLEVQMHSAQIRPEDLTTPRAEVADLDRRIAEGKRRILHSNRVAIDDVELRFLHDRLEQQVCLLRDVRDELLPDLRFRLARARSVEEETAGSYRNRWADALAEIRTSERYAGLAEFGPQRGLVPIGSDPDSHLWEFAHPLSGSIPEREADGKVRLGIEHGLVFVLLPRGTVRFGVDNTVEPARRDDHPEIQIDAFFLAKHEMSRAQWMRLARGIRGLRLRDGGIVDVRNRSGDEVGKPANGVTWIMCDRLLRRYGLDLPTEEEWEYACKASGTTIWNTGDTPDSLLGAANLGEGFSDGYRGLAPVFAELRPNDFGLLQMHGNVNEWCKNCSAPGMDLYRACRGGSWLWPAEFATTVGSEHTAPADRARDTGLRPARRIRRQ